VSRSCWWLVVCIGLTKLSRVVCAGHIGQLLSTAPMLVPVVVSPFHRVCVGGMFCLPHCRLTVCQSSMNVCSCGLVWWVVQFVAYCHVCCCLFIVVLVGLVVSMFVVPEMGRTCTYSLGLTLGVSLFP
jgi:hypothetical protein